MDGATTQAYRTAIEAGANFPPIVVQRVMNYNEEKPEQIFTLLIDGAHRWSAHKKSEIIDCQFWRDETLDYQESKHDLLWASYALNAENAKNLTNKDKKLVARRVAENTPGLTNTEIADRLGVTPTTIGTWVADIRARQSASQQAAIYRLNRLGWTQQEAADVLGLTQQGVAKITTNSKIGVSCNSGAQSIEEQAKFHLLDLPTAYAMALEGKDDTEIMEDLKINVQPYDVWHFSKANPMFGLSEYPGKIPGELIAHVLYFFTQPGDTVIDPMSGGGTTQDVCLIMGRKCFAYDVNTENIDRLDCMQHNLVEGWPDKIKKADLIFWDPPYYNKKHYHEDSVSHATVEDYKVFLSRALREAFLATKGGTRLAFLMSDWDDPEGGPGAFIWDYTRMIADAGWSLCRHIQVPLSTQQVHPDIVLKFRNGRRLARLERYLLIGVKR